MVGINGFGAYVPRYRLTASLLGQAWGGKFRGERAVANYDEDVLTMAVEAARNCLEGLDAGGVDGLYFASTSAPYLEKGNAPLIAAVADLRPDIATAEFGGTLLAGMQAVRCAVDAVKAGNLRRVLVVAAEMRLSEPGGALELTLGDGAAALLVGAEDGLAGFKDFHAVTAEFHDLWRKEDQRFVQSGDPQFVREHGPARQIPAAVSALLTRAGVDRERVRHQAIYSPDAGTERQVLRRLELSGLKDSSSMHGSTGCTGCAMPLIGIVQALEAASAGEIIVAAAYGGGVQAALLEVTRAVSGGGLKRQLEERRELSSYEKYLSFRRLLPAEALNPFTSAPVLWREERENYRLYAGRCKQCGAVNYPQRQICFECNARDDFEEVRLATRGTIYSLTKDHLVPSPEPPVVMASVDLEGGGRFYTQVTDCDPKEIRINQRVELTFRKMHEGGGFNNYFWKFRPLRRAGEPREQGGSN